MRSKSKSGRPRTGSKTEFSLFIIESLEFGDEKAGRLEGKILGDLLRLSRQGIDIEYLYIRTWREFKRALTIFSRSKKRYLHISSHGSSKEVALTLDSIPLSVFGRELAPHVNHRRVFFSACEVATGELAAAVMKGSGCYSVIAPKADISFGDAAIMWASFYHLMFRDAHADSMQGGKIRWALRRLHHTFGEEFTYFNKADNNKGYETVDVNKR